MKIVFLCLLSFCAHFVQAQEISLAAYNREVMVCNGGPIVGAETLRVLEKVDGQFVVELSGEGSSSIYTLPAGEYNIDNEVIYFAFDNGEQHARFYLNRKTRATSVSLKLKPGGQVSAGDRVFIQEENVYQCFEGKIFAQ